MGITSVKEQKSAKTSYNNDISTSREVDGMEETILNLILYTWLNVNCFFPVCRQMFAGKSSTSMVLENSSIDYSMIHRVHNSQEISSNFVTSSQKNTVGDRGRPASSSFPLCVALNNVSSLNASGFSQS